MAIQVRFEHPANLHASVMPIWTGVAHERLKALSERHTALGGSGLCWGDPAEHVGKGCVEVIYELVPLVASEASKRALNELRIEVERR